MAYVHPLKSQYSNGDRDFSALKLHNQNLSFLILCGANFQASDFSSANLSGAALIECDFRKANLAFTNLSNSDLTGANLVGTNLEGASISTATFTNAIYDNSTHFPTGIDPTTLGAINLDEPKPEPERNIEPESASEPAGEQIAQEKTPEAIPAITQQQPISTPPKVPPPTTPPKVPTSPSHQYNAFPPAPTKYVSDWVQPQNSPPPPTQNYNYAKPQPQTPVSTKKSSKGIIALSAFLTVSVGYCISQNLTPTDIGGLEESTNQFDSMRFPRPACGDTMPTRLNAFPVDFYPVFIDYSPQNLQNVSQNFCRDANRPTTRANGSSAIQVASFSSRTRAREFAEFMQSNFGSGDVGQPKTFFEPPNPF